MEPTVQAPTSATPRVARMPALLAATRPAQWSKNLLVFSAPAAAGVLTDPDALLTTGVVAVAFVLASAAIYLLNDTRDRHADAANPRTADRPLASGRLAPGTALAVAALLAVLALATVAMVAPWPATTVLAAYLVLNAGYSLGLKHVALVELMIVASGYLLRAAIGGLATQVELSAWFLTVTSFAALYVVVVKRVTEQASTDHRAVLEQYPPGLLEQVRSLALTATALTYALWAFETGAQVGHPLYQLSVVPFLLALLRYALVTLRDGGASPERVVLGDRGLQVIGAAWVVVVAAAVHA